MNDGLEVFGRALYFSVLFTAGPPFDCPLCPKGSGADMIVTHNCPCGHHFASSPPSFRLHVGKAFLGTPAAIQPKGSFALGHHGLPYMDTGVPLSGKFGGRDAPPVEGNCRKRSKRQSIAGVCQGVRLYCGT